MLSVVIPTLWIPDSKFICSVISNICNHDLVSEVIIIDNDVSKTPSCIFDISDKVSVYSQSQNIYVNPAWNIGVEYSNNDNILILNDDIDTDWSLIDIVHPYITPEYGMIGLGISCWRVNTGTTTTLQPTDYRDVGYACLFFIHKTSYYSIPSQMRIWCGDDYLFLKNRLNHRQNLAIHNQHVTRYNNQFSITSDIKIFDNIKQQDKKYFEHLKSNLI